MTLTTKEAWADADDRSVEDPVNDQELIEFLRDRTLCDSCGETSPRDFRFCPFCAWEKASEEDPSVRTEGVTLELGELTGARLSMFGAGLGSALLHNLGVVFGERRSVCLVVVKMLREKGCPEEWLQIVEEYGGKVLPNVGSTPAEAPREK